MSIEDRVRAATRARAALVRDTRDLELPDDLPGRTRRGRRAERARRWGAWLVPLAAAAVIVALALILAAVRHEAAPSKTVVPAAPVGRPREDPPVLRRYQPRPLDPGFRHRR